MEQWARIVIAVVALVVGLAGAVVTTKWGRPWLVRVSGPSWGRAAMLALVYNTVIAVVVVRFVDQLGWTSSYEDSAPGVIVASAAMFAALLAAVGPFWPTDFDYVPIPGAEAFRDRGAPQGVSYALAGTGAIFWPIWLVVVIALTDVTLAA